MLIKVRDILPSQIAPENRPKPNRKTSIPTIHFLVRSVSFREGTAATTATATTASTPGSQH